MSDVLAAARPDRSAALRLSGCRSGNDIIWRGTVPVTTFSQEIGYLMRREGGSCGLSLTVLQIMMVLG